MFHAPIVAARELNAVEEIAHGPIAGIAVALPLSLALWAVVIGVARVWF